MELERRWNVNINDIPRDDIIKTLHIEQVYANFDPDVRIRKMVDNNRINYIHTVKYFFSNNMREELEQNILKEQYDKIFNYMDLAESPLL